MSVTEKIGLIFFLHFFSCFSSVPCLVFILYASFYLFGSLLIFLSFFLSCCFSVFLTFCLSIFVYVFAFLYSFFVRLSLYHFKTPNVFLECPNMRLVKNSWEGREGVNNYLKSIFRIGKITRLVQKFAVCFILGFG